MNHPTYRENPLLSWRDRARISAKCRRIGKCPLEGTAWSSSCGGIKDECKVLHLFSWYADRFTLVCTSARIFGGLTSYRVAHNAQ